MKILVVRFSSIGDIVLTSPVVRCLKKQLGAEVHFLTKSAFASFQKENPYINKVFSFEKNITDVIPALKSEKYDWVIDLHHNLRSQSLKLQLGRPSKSFDKINIHKWLLVQLGINIMPDTHIVYRYMQTVKHLGVTYDGEGLDFFIPKKDEINLTTLHPTLQPNNYIAFVIGATHATKRLPNKKIIAVCKGLKQQVVLLGGKTEMESGKIIADSVGSNIVNACGTLNLFQSAHVVQQSAQVVTHDTGLMHIAAAFDKKMLSIWGNTVPSFGMTPFFKNEPSKNIVIENTNLSCRPCSKIGFEVCPKGHFKCMQDLDNLQIIAEINR
jgi:ADP-heptose:LPS heptosyltransferase